MSDYSCILTVKDRKSIQYGAYHERRTRFDLRRTHPASFDRSCRPRMVELKTRHGSRHRCLYDRNLPRTQNIMASKVTLRKPHPQIDQLCLYLDSMGIEHCREYIFHPTRKWRFDISIPSRKIAIEYHGHTGFRQGGASGHSTIKGLSNDCEKSNHAQILGWKIFAFTALHFRERERIRHKLVSPILVLERILNTK